MRFSHYRHTFPRDRKGSTSVIVLVVAALMVVGGMLAYWQMTRPASDALVVYCAHDRVFSEKILRDFEAETGIAVEVRFDTEATKSLGLTELLIAEKNNPRCDVFWNNEQLAMMQLKKEGVLQFYKGAGYARIPTAYKDDEGYWTGFAARMRVWIVNTDKMPATPEAVEAAHLKDDLSNIAIAKPLYGTTRTHYTVLWDQWGKEVVQDWHEHWRQSGVVEQGGNANVKDLVAAGECHLGLTDTDDFFVAKDAGFPVTALPYRVGDENNVISIPNTVAVINGTKRVEQAQQLVEYLLSEKTQLALANSPSRQIPLGPVDESKLSEEVKQLKQWAANAYPLNDLETAAEECLAWLREQYAP